MAAINVTDNITAVDCDGDTILEVVCDDTSVWIGTVPDQEVFTSSGTFTAPADCVSISFVIIGSGGAVSGDGGGGGELCYKNDVPVTPGAGYTVTIQGADSSSHNSIVINGTTYSAAGTNSKTGGTGGTNMDACFAGGDGGHTDYRFGGGGSAGGYSHAGVNGASGTFANAGANGQGGSGGSGACCTTSQSGGGGGTGLNGEGSNGTGGVVSVTATSNGTGGSGGAQNGTWGYGGSYGAGAGDGRTAAAGAIRIIWPGSKRQYPSTRTGDE